MNGHTEEPLYGTFFDSGDQAAQFIRAVREGIHHEDVHRHTPPGPLVIYGPRLPAAAERVTLFVTSGILRAAELLQLHLARGAKLVGASALPPDVVVLFAHLGGSGLEPRDPDAPNDSTLP